MFLFDCKPLRLIFLYVLRTYLCSCDFTNIINIPLSLSLDYHSQVYSLHDLYQYLDLHASLFVHVYLCMFIPVRHAVRTPPRVVCVLCILVCVCVFACQVFVEWLCVCA